MKNRILVSKKPNEDETRCAYCNKIIEAKKYKTHLKQVHEVGLKKRVKESVVTDLMGVSENIDNALMLKQTEFEKELNVMCPVCKITIMNKSLQTHLAEHKDAGADSSNQALGTQKNHQIICPLCRISISSPVRHHLRKVHFMELDAIANGIFETADTIKKREAHLANLKKEKMSLLPD